MNYFQTNPEYIFKDDDLKNKIKTLKGINDLKNKYKNFHFEKCFIIKQKNNGKDWDAGLVIKYEEKGIIKYRLFLLQISINKTVKQIQNIIRFLDRKIKFIKEKIFSILGIQINEAHILFIFNHSTVSNITFKYCNNFKIPYIVFSYMEHNFVSDDYEKINYNILLDITNFNKNWEIWKKFADYEIYLMEKIEDEEESFDIKINENGEEDGEDIYWLSCPKEGNIITDKNFSLNYFN